MQEYTFPPFSFHETPSYYLAMGVYYGLALMSVIFNIVFYFIFKNKSFIAYCVLLFTTALTFFYEDGLFFYLSNGRWTIPYFTVWNSSITAIAALVFTYYFLDLEPEFNRYKKWFYGACGILCFGALLYSITLIPMISHVVLATCFLFALTALYLAIRRFKHDIYARFLTLAFSLLVLTGMFYALHTRTDYPAFEWFNISVFRLFSTAEIIMISFAIIFRVKILQQENEFYREELTKYLQDMDEKKLDQLIDEYSESEAWTAYLEREFQLTDREAEVLECIWQGLTNKEISEKLFITLSTTKYHISNLYNKLEVKNRNQAQALSKTLPISGNLVQSQ